MPAGLRRWRKKMESKKALVLGLGTSGYASALYLAERGWSVRVMDTRREPSLLARLKEHPEISFTGGALDPAAVEGTSLVMISPGLSPEFSDAAPIVSEAKRLGVEVVGEIELFARELARLREEKGYHPKVIGITGTNGKTTTTSLTAKMLNAGGVSAVAAGNIGPNAVTELTEHDKAGTLPDAWVLELSSFQLQTTESLFCDAAAITNVPEDHIDWHGNFDAYLNAKRRILKPETLAVLNREDPLSAGSALPGEKTETFGSDAPKAPGEWGIAERDGVKWLATAEAADDGVRLQYLMPAGALKIRGVHNAMNALTSLALARAAGAAEGKALQVLAHYEGEPHRTQFVLTASGVDFIDDSKGTDVGATAAGLKGLGEAGQKIVVLLGGDGKGQDFGPLEPAIRTYARGAVTYGRDGGKIADAIRSSGVPLESAATVEEATRKAFAMAKPGDAVMLSPACASWDMFPNYAVRAEVFRSEAAKIAEEAASKC